MAKVPDGSESDDPQAREVFRRLAGDRGGVGEMYRSLLNNPEVASLIGQLGTHYRFGSDALPEHVRELVILATAAHYRSSYEWVNHAPVAREAGLPEEVIEALREGRDPGTLTAPQASALETARCVLERRSLPQELQDRVVGEFGYPGLIELVTLVGFYGLIQTVIDSFAIGAPQGTPDPFA